MKKRISQLSAKTSTKMTSTRHPIFGCMKGRLTIAPDVDLTEPMCPNFEAYSEKKYGPASELGKVWARYVENENKRSDE